jgi:SAM-dependent methyltransferase
MVGLGSNTGRNDAMSTSTRGAAADGELRSFDPQHDAEFDDYADGYEDSHARSIRASGEPPAYFAKYKRDALLRMAPELRALPLLDFGCGIGNLTTHLSETCGNVHGYDPSLRSSARARLRCPDATIYDDAESIPKNFFRAAVVANVLHHVKPDRRLELIQQVARSLTAGGQIFVFEHNPWNPLTRKAVRDCPFDVDAALLRRSAAVRLLRQAGLRVESTAYIVFFPRALERLRFIEPQLGFLPLGAQYMVVGARHGSNA